MWGFGSPDQPSLETDVGFGAPFLEGIETPHEWGFGSPYPSTLLEVLVISGPVISDVGGDIVFLRASWRDGPYRVHLRDAQTLQEFPPNPLGCNAPIEFDSFRVKARTNPHECFPMRSNGQYLQFIAPPAPPGLYSLVVRSGAAYGEVSVMERALRVVYRNPAKSTHNIRQRLPRERNYRAAGPAALRAVPLVYDTEEVEA